MWRWELDLQREGRGRPSAYAVTDDHAAQERVFEQLGAASPQYIRRLLTENEVSLRDRRVRYVTLKAYEKAGGTLKRDLFSDEEDGTFIADIPLLDRLVAEKLERAAAPVRKEGWKWIDVRAKFEYADQAQLKQLQGEPLPCPRSWPGPWKSCRPNMTS